MAIKKDALSTATGGIAEPSFTLGIEEEYLLVSRETGALVEQPQELMAECEQRLGKQVSPEFLRSQVEIGTKVHSSLADARDDLAHLRATVAQVAEQHGLAPIAASTHPVADWHDQKPTDKERYSDLARDMQTVARRLLICGMHVHVAIEDEDLRVDLMNQVAYFLPHLLVLTTSSPFWGGEPTGLLSYRLCVFDELPRTGLPERFESYGEYQRHVDMLVHAGLIEDASKIWWDVRPSCRYPTLEVRIADLCTRLEDNICVAALYRCLLRMLYRLRRSNQRWRIYAGMLIQENRWRAQRYGYEQGLVDFGRGCIVPYPDLLEEILALVREDAEFFDCVAEVDHARTILKRGTSAHRQLATYQQAIDDGASREQALKAVVDQLIEDTVAGCS